ncbi:hypothetical protein KR215_001955 [Drosophila sulfurigaster]|nr:hypothetical protein KR215_001955 [Drosophila sulfurigaster]
MLKNFQQTLIKLLREVSVEITKELGAKQPKQETLNPNKLDETWCLPYGNDSMVIVKSSREGNMSIRVESLSIEQQSIDPKSFAEQQQYKEPTEHSLEYPSINPNPLRFQHEIDDYCRQLASDNDNDSEDQSNDDDDNNVAANKNNKNTNAVEVVNSFEVYNDHIESDWNNLHSVDNTVALGTELDSDCGSNWSGSNTLCSDKSESTLQLEISDREYQ